MLSMCTRAVFPSPSLLRSCRCRPTNHPFHSPGAHRVVSREVDRLIGRVVCQEHPVPGGQQEVGGFDVAVAHTRGVGLGHGLDQLASYPELQCIGTGGNKVLPGVPASMCFS